ncbi:STAS domain-containing protein [Georgenia muralis]|uniref:Anti-anti-sigma factor n=1 Tax=Georgenia muralis TaxID=154117 RepID=A0A3N4Z8W0_9MICO|nr:STAS domain-containing protein [Georgenia muralis]RPF28707.1 anti-anti-sigma factor [Georgenia muralis]
MDGNGSPSVVVDEEEGTTRLVLAGEIDAGIADDVAHALQRVAAHDTPVDIDLAGVTFMDCYGLRILQAVVGRVSAPVRVVAASAPVRFLLETAGLTALAADGPGSSGPDRAVDLSGIAPLAVARLYLSEPLTVRPEQAEPQPVGTARTDGGLP